MHDGNSSYKSIITHILPFNNILVLIYGSVRLLIISYEEKTLLFEIMVDFTITTVLSVMTHMEDFLTGDLLNVIESVDLLKSSKAPAVGAT
jgi:hypothetical protein